MPKGLDSSGLTFRQDYFDDPAAWEALVSLLRDTFGIDLGPLQQLGGPDPTSMPFGWFDADGRLAANLSVFALPLVVNGRVLNAAAFQSGAVRPRWRSRGLYRDVTRKALDWCEQQGFEAIVLYTDKPSLYEPYGFQSLPLHLYSGRAPAPAVSITPVRAVNPALPADLALLQSALRTRTTISDSLAVTANAAMFLINTQLDADVRLSWLAEEQAVVAWKMDSAGRFILLDAVAPEIPPLAVILGGLGIRPAFADVLFRPDKLKWDADPLPLGSGTQFMLRAANNMTLDFPGMLSPMADF